MCGFAGFIDLTRSRCEDEQRILAEEMGETVRHRGPDDGGVWVDVKAGFAVGFRRLSIIDLSSAGRQPMVAANGRFVIAYNGEVYNTEDIRPELEARGVRFRGHSDTEVLLEACAAWGVDRAVKRVIGMFAFALWDREERTLALVRDRLGIKPLYWGRSGNTVFFGSQPKAFFKHPDWRPEVCRESLAAYLRFGYVPAQRSIFKGMAQVRPGHIGFVGEQGGFRETCYWDIEHIAASGVATPATFSDEEAVDALEDVLRDAVRRRMLADVPCGAFLSGGVDSSTVVSLMQLESREPVKTFSIGFTAKDYNEAPFAKAVAEHLGTDHHELYVEPRHAIDVIPGLPDHYDEPFADSSQIPTFLVSELARGHVTVSLSGDGGDELFAGYTRYAQAEQLLAVIGRIPGALHGPLTAGLEAVARALPARLSHHRVARRLGKLADLLRRGGKERLYRGLLTLWDDPAALARSGSEAHCDIWHGSLAEKIPDFGERMTFIDMVTYLPGDILTKVDRASMAVGLEVRVPLLDHRVVELCWRLPRRFKVRGRDRKWLLRQVLYRHVPRALIERPKMGFGVPIGQWLRGPLRDWAEDLLSERRLREAGYLDSAPIRARWEQHLSGAIDWQYPLWVILMFQAWQARWLRH